MIRTCVYYVLSIVIGLSMVLWIGIAFLTPKKVSVSIFDRIEAILASWERWSVEFLKEKG